MKLLRRSRSPVRSRPSAERSGVSIDGAEQAIASATGYRSPP